MKNLILAAIAVYVLSSVWRDHAGGDGVRGARASHGSGHGRSRRLSGERRRHSAQRRAAHRTEYSAKSHPELVQVKTSRVAGCVCRSYAATPDWVSTAPGGRG